MKAETPEPTSANSSKKPQPPVRKWNYGWVVIGVFLVIDSSIMGLTFSLGLMLPLISDDLGMSLRQSGWLGSANWMVNAILAVFLASWLSRYSPKKLITLATLFGAPLIFVHGWAPNYWVLLLSRVAFMAVTLARLPARPLLIQQWFPVEKIATVNAVLTIGMGAVGGTMIFFMGDLIEALNGWRNTFYLFGFISVLVLAVWVILGRENPASAAGMRREARERLPLKALFKYKVLWLVGLGLAGAALSWGTMFTLWPQYAIPEGIVTLKQASRIHGLGMYGFMAGAILCGLISTRIGRRKPLLWVPGLLFPFLTLGILFSHSFTVIAILWTIWGIMFIFFPIVMTIPYEIPGIKPQEVAVATAFVMTMFTAGAALGPIMAGHLADAFSLKLALGVSCLFGVLLFISGLLIPETGPRARADKG